MKIVSLIAGILAVAAQVTAQIIPNQNQSAPSNLIIITANSTLNGSALGACHSGAAIESLCVYGTYVSNFTFNFTSHEDFDPTIGLLTWALPYGNQSFLETMSFFYNPSSNVALPLFYPEDYGFQVQFTASNELVVPPGYIEDAKLPNVTYSTHPLRRWQVCETYYGSYLYTTLAWVLGKGRPENPTCHSAKVVRVFI